MPVVLLFATVTMLVLRAGASRIFFDVVGSFQATRLIGDAQAKITVLQGLMLDGLSGITEGLGLIGEQIQQVVDSTVPLAKELGFARIEFEKFVQAGDDAELLAGQIENLGSQFGFTADQALAAGAKMAQLSSVVGGGAAIPAATEVGIAFGMIGGMQTEEAMKRLIALQQQTGFMYGELTKAQFDTLSSQKRVNVIRQESIKVLNQLNTVENRSSATMAQVTHVMNQFASSAKLAGDDLSYMAAMSATLIEAGEEQGKAGRALKMMYARLGADTGNNSEILRKYGIETKQADGNLRSMHDILADISGIYPQLSSRHRMEIAQAIAGNDHYVRAIKLMDGYQRSLELNSMAIQELDAASDELNIRFQDNAFLLQQAESRLTDAKAAVGGIFTPAVIRATNAQAALNEQFAEFASQDDGFGRVFGAIADGVVRMQQMGKIFAPMVEANLNMMSLTVSLQTQLQIQRAIAGQDLVKASAYGQQGALARANLDTIEATAQVENQRALTAASLLRFDKQRFDAQQAILGMGKLEQTNNRAKLLEQRAIIQGEINELTAKKQKLELEKAILAPQYKGKMTRQANLQLQIQELETQKANLRIKHQQAVLDEMATQHDRYRNLSAEKILAYKDGAVTKTVFLNKLKEREATILQQEAQLNQQINGLMDRKASVARSLEFAGKVELEQKKQLLKANANMLAQEGQRNIQALRNATAIQGETQAAKILRNAHFEIIAITMQKSSAENQNNLIMEQAEKAARELAMAYGLDEAALRKLIPQLAIFRNALDGVQVKTKQTVDAAMFMNMQLMRFTGVLGGASMALSMFSEDEKMARTSMILMNLSMIPMTLQMVTATKASFGLMTGLNGAGKAAGLAAFNMRAFNKALIAFGKATVVIGAISYIAYKLMPDMDDGAESLAESFDGMSRSALYAGEAYRNMASSLEMTDLQGVQQMRLDAEQAIADIQSDMANITEPALLRIKQEQLDALKEELSVLQDIEAVRQAQALSSDLSEAEELFNAAQAYKNANDEFLKQQAKGETVGGKIFGFFEDYVAESAIEGAGGAFGMEYETHEELVRRLGEEAAASFAAIPAEYQGAVLEAALMAESLPDFLDILDRDFREFQQDNEANGFGFDGAGAKIEEEFIGPIEAAREAAFEFSNAREEMFFGMAKGNITGDMVKQVVNKGVETLVASTEVIMTNNFNGMTTTQAANEITKQVVEQLNGLGLNIQNA